MSAQKIVDHRHPLGPVIAGWDKEGTPYLEGVVYQGREFIVGNGTCPEPLRLSAEAEKRYVAYPALVAAIEAITLQYYGSCVGGGLPLIKGVRACTAGLGEAIEAANKLMATPRRKP